MKKLSTVCYTIAGILLLLSQIASFLIYVYTIYIAFLSYGFGGGLLSMVLPLVSSVFFAIALWILNGFFNAFTVSCFLLLICWGLAFLFGMLGKKLEESANSKPSEWDNVVHTMERYGMLKTENDREILSYINSKAAEMNVTPEEYIKQMKENDNNTF
jgi:hypothetical protein